MSLIPHHGGHREDVLRKGLCKDVEVDVVLSQAVPTDDEIGEVVISDEDAHEGRYRVVFSVCSGVFAKVRPVGRPLLIFESAVGLRYGREGPIDAAIRLEGYIFDDRNAIVQAMPLAICWGQETVVVTVIRGKLGEDVESHKVGIHHTRQDLPNWKKHDR